MKRVYLLDVPLLLLLLPLAWYVPSIVADQ